MGREGSRGPLEKGKMEPHWDVHLLEDCRDTAAPQPAWVGASRDLLGHCWWGHNLAAVAIKPDRLLLQDPTISLPETHAHAHQELGVGTWVMAKMLHKRLMSHMGVLGSRPRSQL